MRFLLLFFFCCFSFSLFAKTIWTFQIMLSRYDTSVILAVGGVEVLENGSVAWGGKKWQEVGWYQGSYYYAFGPTSKNYIGRASTYAVDNATDAERLQNTLSNAAANGELGFIDYSKGFTYPESGDLALYSLRSVGSVSYASADGQEAVRILGYNSDGDLTSLSAVYDSVSGMWVADGYDSTGKKGKWSVSPSSFGKDYTVSATFSQVFEYSEGSDGVTLGENTSTFLGGGSSGGGSSGGGSIGGVIKVTLDNNITPEKFTSSESINYVPYFNELIEGEQAILDYLLADSGEMEDVEIKKDDIVPSEKDVDTLVDEVENDLSDLPQDSSSFESSFSFVSGYQSVVKDVFGSFPSVGSGDFKVQFDVEAGAWSFPVNIDLTQFPLSTIRAAFAVVILFLASVFSVRVVGGAFES